MHLLRLATRGKCSDGVHPQLTPLPLPASTTTPNTAHDSEIARLVDLNFRLAAQLQEQQVACDTARVALQEAEERATVSRSSAEWFEG